MKEKLKKSVQFIMKPRLLLCFGLAWIITNGWSYIGFAVGTYFGIVWMIAVGGGYLAFLWLPVSPEKIVTVAISIVLLRFLFPNDQKTLAVLLHMRDKIKLKRQQKKEQKNGISSDVPAGKADITDAPEC